MKDSVTYFLRRKRTIYCNLRCNGFELARSTGIHVDNPDSWTGKPDFNRDLDLYDTRIREILKISKDITPDSVFEILEKGTDNFNPAIASIPSTVSMAFDYYTREMDKLKNFSVHTLKNYENMKKMALAYVKDRYKLSDVNLSFINPVFARDIKLWLREKEYSGDTESQFLTIFKAVIQLVIDEFPQEDFPLVKISKNPFQNKKILGKGVIKKSSRISGYLSPEKEAILWDEYEKETDEDNRNILLIALLIWNTGLSFGDLCTHVDVVKDIRNGDLFCYNRKKSKKQARIIIYPELQRILDIIQSKREQWEDEYDNWLPIKRFVDRSGVEDYEMYKFARNRVCYMFRSRLKDILGHVTPHLLRHSFAVKMLFKGHSMDVVAKFLGDTISTTEKHYGFITNDQILREKEIILNRKSV